jgi:phytoene dehydrogenase-like protein
VTDVIVGSGPNGMAAAITLARAGREVVVLEAAPSAGGGLRTEELTLPGYRHDVCSTAFPLAAASPFFRQLSPAMAGVELLHPQAVVAHPLDDGSALAAFRGPDCTTEGAGDGGRSWAHLMAPLVEHAETLVAELLRPLRPPRHPVTTARFGLPALLPATTVARHGLSDERSRALFCGIAAHMMVSLRRPGTASAGLLLGMLAHHVGWPFARGGSDSIAGALVGELERLGGRVVTDHRVDDIAELNDAELVMLDLSPRQVVAVAGHRLTPRYTGALRRYRYGPGAFKLDWALSEPIPWRAAACRHAGIVHIGGSMNEIVTAEEAVARGAHPEKPFVLLAQPTIVDPGRAPSGRHIAWAYCHVPNASDVDMSERIEAQVERFAPGFRDTVTARSIMSPRRLETHDANYVGGDINGGSMAMPQLLLRPTRRWNPYRTSDPRVYICSSCTPPGGGVHGLCGMHAAQSALHAASRGRQPRRAS